MGNIKKEHIIVAVIILVAFIVVLVVGKLTEVKLIVGVGKASGTHENFLISSYEEFETFAEEVKLEDKMEIDLKTKEYKTYYNEEFFQNHKLAAILNREDTSKVFIHSVDDLSYSNGRKTATITYTSKAEGYNGTLKSAWTNVMLVELDKNVEDVNFVKSVSEEKK